MSASIQMKCILMVVSNSEILVIVVIMVKSSKYAVIIMLKYNYNQSDIYWYLLMSLSPMSNLPRHNR